MKASRFSDAQMAFILRQARRGHAGRRGLPEGRDQRGDVLQLAEEVRRADAVGDEAAAAARGGERRLKKIVADLSLDKEMLQDVIRRKL